jgi:hypothetical protein
MDIKDDLSYMIAKTFEYVESICDENYTFDDFFEDMEVPRNMRNDFTVAAMLSQAQKRGLI